MMFIIFYELDLYVRTSSRQRHGHLRHNWPMDGKPRSGDNDGSFAAAAEAATMSVVLRPPPPRWRHVRRRGCTRRRAGAARQGGCRCATRPAGDPPWRSQAAPSQWGHVAWKDRMHWRDYLFDSSWFWRCGIRGPLRAPLNPAHRFPPFLGAKGDDGRGPSSPASKQGCCFAVSFWLRPDLRGTACLWPTLDPS